MTALPFAPYEGQEPYIFVSYAHKNKDKVYPIIKRLHEMGYRLWYDEGIEAGDKWFKVISDHLRRSACMLLFWSPEAEKSQWVGKEILIALNNGIRIAGSVIIQTTIPDELVDVQMLFHENFDSNEAFLDKLVKGLPDRTVEVKPALPEPQPVLETQPRKKTRLPRLLVVTTVIRILFIALYLADAIWIWYRWENMSIPDFNHGMILCSQIIGLLSPIMFFCFFWTFLRGKKICTWLFATTILLDFGSFFGYGMMNTIEGGRPSDNMFPIYILFFILLLSFLCIKPIKAHLENNT